jgi:hypothetical protein
MSTTFVATEGLEAAPIQNGSVLYDPRTGKFIMLNGSAAFLWTELRAPRTENELVHRLCAIFPDVAPPDGRRDVGQALEHLKELELVVCKGDTTGVEASTPAPESSEQASTSKPPAYECPSLRVLDEEELLKIFQMTAAEISVASCWWGACTVGCP